MFKFSNLFKHSVNYKPEIQEIHHTIDMSSEKALEEARKILLELEEKTNDRKAERLQKLGFRSVSAVKELQEINLKKAKLKKVRDRIEFYAGQYPLNKFITNEEAESVCKKYNLYIGDVPFFTGFVPERNLQEMETFMERYGLQYCRQAMGSVYGNVDLVSKEEFENQQPGFFYSSQTCMLQIIAPENQFAYNPGYRKVGRRLIDDPIVLMPVQDGYIVVTAWGDEASDPAIVNNQMN